jgi:hypothetical protein
MTTEPVVDVKLTVSFDPARNSRFVTSAPEPSRISTQSSRTVAISILACPVGLGNEAAISCVVAGLLATPDEPAATAAGFAIPPALGPDGAAEPAPCASALPCCNVDVTSPAATAGVFSAIELAGDALGSVGLGGDVIVAAGTVLEPELIGAEGIVAGVVTVVVEGAERGTNEVSAAG